ncbi:MAG: hypothetical protein ACRD8Z_11885 [Nitrososphaeraceae archaeon]
MEEASNKLEMGIHSPMKQFLLPSFNAFDADEHEFNFWFHHTEVYFPVR